MTMGSDAENLQADQVSEWLREGVAAVKAGHNEYARELLIRVVAHDDQNAQAWLWLSGVVESLEDRKVCLENVLGIDPDNAAARKGLTWVQRQMQEQPETQMASPLEQGSPFTVPPDAVLAEPEPPVVERTRTPVSPAAAMLKEDFASRRSEPKTALIAAESEPSVETQSPSPVSSTAVVLADLPGGEPVPESEAGPALPPSAGRNEFANEYLCPYCAAETEPNDRKCRSCGKDLWVKFRKQEKRSTLLWILVALQFVSAVYSAVPVLLFLAFGSSFFGEFLGVAGMSPLVMYLLALPSLFSIGLAVGLCFRWKPVYYLFIVDSVIGVISAIFALAGGSALFSVSGFLLALGRFALIMQLGGDFEWDRRRILLRTDRGLKRGVEYLMRADFYNRQKMWALAVVHLQAALGLMPDRLDCHLALAVAYIHLKRYDLADGALAEAKRIKPGEPRIAQLEALVAEMRPAVPAALPEGQVA
jgi:tetratricopeptide (TPR) repeat protein